jgi:hypothetical protein
MTMLAVHNRGWYKSVAAAQQFAVPDLLPWPFFKRFLLAKLLYNLSCLAHPQAGKLMSVSWHSYSTIVS